MSSFDWLSDLQPLFAAQASWLEGTYNKPVKAALFAPSQTPFSIACGAGLLAEHVRRFKFSPALIQRLGQVTDADGRSVFQESFLNHLQRIRLRTHVQAAPEGTLLLPGEPLLLLQGPELQVLLLESALQWLIWESTCIATESARQQWTLGHFSEEETPHPEHFSFDPPGWKKRARYIGGGEVTELSKQEENIAEWPGLSLLEQDSGQMPAQIRRLFKGEQPLGDVWLTAEQDQAASVSHTHIQFQDRRSGKPVEIHMTRFLNLMQPLLVKGYPVWSAPGADYLRQRTWKQLEGFGRLDLGGYGMGWLLG